MKPRTLRSILLLAAVCVLALMLSRYPFDDAELPQVALPSAPVSSDSHQSSDQLGQGQYTAAEVNPSTVQAVVGQTLDRTDAYSRSITVERFWQGGSSTEILDCHIRGNEAHIISDPTGEKKHTLILDDALYIWYGSNSRSFKGIPSSSSQYGNIADEFSGLITYEELLETDTALISDAGYTVYGDESCIWAQYKAGQLGYTSKVYVSIATGLLMGAERYDGEDLIYRMTSDVPAIEMPAESLFAISS